MGLARMVQLSPEEVDLELTKVMVLLFEPPSWLLLSKVNDALPENKILLISVLNALHPITVEVLHKVGTLTHCSSFYRIKIFFASIHINPRKRF